MLLKDAEKLMLPKSKREMIMAKKLRLQIQSKWRLKLFSEISPILYET